MKFLVLNIQLFAHKKGQGSTKNGRDSIAKRLGAKAADGEYVSGGSILYRQRGTKVYPGVNCGIGSDDTVYAKVIVIDNTCVGGDIMTLPLDGFMHSLSYKP